MFFRWVCPRAAVTSYIAVDGRYYFLLRFECSLLFPGVLWMVTVILEWLLLFPVVFCCTLDVCCYFLVRCAWSLPFLGVFWLVAVVSCCTLDGHCFFLVPSGWSLLFRGAFTSNTCHTQANTRQSNDTTPNKPKYCARAHLPNCYECPPQKSGGHSLPSASLTAGASCCCPKQKIFPLPPLALVVLHFASQPLQRAVWSISCIADCMLLSDCSVTDDICKQVAARLAQAQAEACIRPITPAHFFQLPPITGLSTQSPSHSHCFFCYPPVTKIGPESSIIVRSQESPARNPRSFPLGTPLGTPSGPRRVRAAAGSLRQRTSHHWISTLPEQHGEDRSDHASSRLRRGSCWCPRPIQGSHQAGGTSDKQRCA